MRRFWGNSIMVLAMVAVGAGCVSGNSGSSSATTEPPRQPETETGTEMAAEDDQASANRLPEGYDVVGATVEEASGTGERTALRQVSAVGPTDADPRLIEYTLYEFDDEESALAAVAASGAVSVVEPIALERGGSVGFVEATIGLRDRLGLTPHGPGFDAFFQVRVAPTLLAVGGSAVIQPVTLAPLLESLSTDSESFGQGLPDGMAVLVNETPLVGTTFELQSINGTTNVEVYFGASRSWFEYNSWGLATKATDGDLVDLGIDVRVRSPEFYGLGGAATDPEQTMIWSDERLMIVSHRDTTPSADLAELISYFLELDEDALDALANSVGSNASVDNADRADEVPAADRKIVSEAPTVDDMARLQSFVERARGIEAGQPIAFEFIDDFPVTDASGTQFLSRDLWLAAVALGLTEDGQTLEGANQARIDRIKGTPGMVELQATRTFTDVVVVHEMVHVIDPPAQVTTDPELLSLGQAVAEGNAHRIAFDFVASLPEDERVVVPVFPGIFGPEGDERISTAVQDLLEFPYDEGRVFMAEIADRGGEALVESVLRRPPVSTEQLLFADAWEADDVPATVQRPTAPDGAESLSGGTLGVYMLYLTAREAGLGQEAMGVLDQWTGDAFVIYQDDRRTCLAAQILMDSNGAAAELEDLLDQAGSLRSSVTASAVDAVFCS